MTDTVLLAAPAPAAAPPAAAPAPVVRSSGNGAFLAVLIALIALALSGFTAYQQWYGKPTGVQGYYVLDLQRLLTAKMAQVMDTPGVDSAAEAKKLVADMNRVLQEYGASGVLVVKKEMVMSVTPDQEITEAVAQKLGIDLSRSLQDVARRQVDSVLAASPRAAGPMAPSGAATPGAPAAAPKAPAAGNDPLAQIPPELRDVLKEEFAAPAKGRP